MAKKFISVLGTGKYKICNYKYKNKIISDRYIQKALVDIFCENWTSEDKAIVFTTKEAKEKHWSGHFEDGTSLSEEFSNINLKVENIDIPMGSNEEELWSLFEKIYNSLEENDEIIVDITHSFRTIPMFLIIILNYAKVLKNIKVLGIYYGAYEARKENEEGVEIAPIFDLTMYDLLMDFTNGINTFLKTGNSSVLAETCSEINREACKNKDYSFTKMNSAISSLDNFSKSIMTCRGNMSLNDDKKAIGGAYNKFIKELSKYEKVEDKLSKALSPLFEKVKEETNEFEEMNPVSNGISTVKWCIKKGFVQQGITALEETMKTFLCFYINNKMSKNLRYYDKHDREEICNKILKSNKGCIKEIIYKDEVKEVLNANIIPERLFVLEEQISEIRNDINHFGMREQAESSKKLGDKLEVYFNEFLEIIKELN